METKHFGAAYAPNCEGWANQLTRQFAELVRGEPKFFPAPGVVRSAENRRFFLTDQYVRQTMELFPRITVAIVGIGAVGESRAKSSSGVVFDEQEIASARKRGAVGDICLRFFDARGRPVVTGLDELVIGIGLEQFRRIERRIGVAGGPQKVRAILGALEGGWINGLVTDRTTAQSLVGGAS